MSQVHPCARTTPRTRSEIHTLPTSVMILACLYNITVATIRKWKGRKSSQDRSYRPHTLNTTLIPAQERATGKHVFDVSCATMGIEHRLSPPRHPQTNGMVERFNGRISGVVKQTRFASATELETTLTLFKCLQSSYPAACFESPDVHPVIEKMVHRKTIFIC